MGRKGRSAVYSPASGALTSVFGKLAGKQRGRLRSIRFSGLSLPIDFRKQGGSRTSATAVRATLKGLSASRPVSLARTFRSRDRGASARASKALEAVSSGKSFVSSASFAPNGWSLRTSRGCSLSTMAATSKECSLPCPTAGMWGIGECLMLRISESPRTAVAFSWSRVLDVTPRWSCWLMPLQWSQFLARAARSTSQGRRLHSLALPLRLRTRRAGSVWGVRFSWLKRTDGVRWFSGSECLRYMGFPADWMTSTFLRLTRPATPSSRPLLDGLPKS